MTNISGPSEGGGATLPDVEIYEASGARPSVNHDPGPSHQTVIEFLNYVCMLNGPRAFTGRSELKTVGFRVICLYKETVR